MPTADPQPFETRLVRSSFERAAGRYDQVASLQMEVADRLVQRLDFIRVQPRRVADLGAGTGYCARHLSRRYRGARVYALDIALSMLQRARHKAPRLFARTAYVCGDLQRLPLGDGTLDLILSNLTLQWCPELTGTFRDLARALSPGGLLLFSTFGPDTLKELRESWAQADRHIHVNDFPDMHDIGDTMAAAGLKDVVMDVDRITVDYPDVYALMRELKAMGAHNVNRDRPHGLTGKGRIARLLAAYEGYRCDGRLPATYEVVYGHAWAPEAPGAVAVPITSRRS